MKKSLQNMKFIKNSCSSFKKYTLFFLILLNLNALRAEVFDCFTFFNELELLRLRFEELYDVVDHFVIVESPISFTGKSKPLYYQENAHLFERFNDKVIHIIIDHFPDITDKVLEYYPDLKNEEKNHWYRECYSRDAILNGLKDCKEDDVIIISDVDEIPRACAIEEIKLYLGQFEGFSLAKRRMLEDTSLVCGLDMRLFMYFMNRENFAGWYGGSKATPYWMVCKHKPWGIKTFHHKYAMHKICNAGWHFNTMGGMDRSLEKWMLTGPIYYQGAEDALEKLKNNPDLLKKSFYDQVLYHTSIIQIDSSYPKYFLANIDHFQEMGWIDDESWKIK